MSKPTTLRINATYHKTIGKHTYFCDINTTNGVGATRVGSNINKNSSTGELFINELDHVDELAAFVKESITDFEERHGSIEQTPEVKGESIK